MSANHTPGPWVQDEGDPLCVGTPKSWYPRQVYNIVTVLEGGPEYTDEANAEAEANARLIAAAPELLDALRAAHAVLKMYARHKEVPIGRKMSVFSMVEEALEKAGSAEAPA